MSFLIPALLAGGGAAASAYGGSGKQGGVNTSQQTQQSQQQDTTQQQSATGAMDSSVLQRMLENPAFAGMREQLIPLVMAELNRAKQPVYGEAQKASYLSSLNDLAQNASGALKSQLARTGGLNAGRFATGLGNIEMGRAGQAANFFSQLPFAESAARAERMNPLLTMATGWAGRSPLDTQTTGSQTSNQQMTGTGSTKTSGTSSTTGTQSMFGPSFLKSLLGNLGGQATDMFTRMLPGGSFNSWLGSRGKPKNPYTGFGGWIDDSQP